MCARRSGRRKSVPFDRNAPLPIEHAYPAPLTVGLVSDTHVYPGSRRGLPLEIPALFRRFGCGLILHGGDACTRAVIDVLETVAPTLVVEGNNDLAELREIASIERVVTVGGATVALLHGHGGASARSHAKVRFGGRADLVVYGHSHIPMIERDDAGTVYVNPGSPTDKRWHPHFGIGIVRFDGDRIDPELILFDDPRELDRVQPLTG